VAPFQLANACHLSELALAGTAFKASSPTGG
jgi:hypothetical protein